MSRPTDDSALDQHTAKLIKTIMDMLATEPVDIQMTVTVNVLAYFTYNNVPEPRTPKEMFEFAQGTCANVVNLMIQNSGMVENHVPTLDETLAGYRAQ